MNETRINVADWIDEHHFGVYQILIVILCGLAATLDGYDNQVISFVAPALVKIWHFNPGLEGTVFSIGLFGLMIGALLSGPVADRIGRKYVVVASVVIFGVFSFWTVSAANVTNLLWLRFFTGLGLGGSMPNVIALTAEYSPEKIRKTTVSAMFIGFPVGAVVGGLLAARLIPTVGWQSLFYIGGIAPIILAIILVLCLPESIRFLVQRNATSLKVSTILSNMHRSAAPSAGTTYYLPENRGHGFTVGQLFQEGRAIGTLLLWLVFFMNLLIIYFIVNWLPTILAKETSIGVVVLQAGGIVGGLILGYGADRKSPRWMLGGAFVLGAVSLALIGFTAVSGPVMLFIFLSGLFVVGAQFGINALAASVYPTAIRSTGVSWAFGVGRLGSVIGPMIGGLLVTDHATLPAIFMVAAIPALLAAIAIAFLRFRPAATHSAIPDGLTPSTPGS